MYFLENGINETLRCCGQRLECISRRCLEGKAVRQWISYCITVFLQIWFAIQLISYISSAISSAGYNVRWIQHIHTNHILHYCVPIEKKQDYVYSLFGKLRWNKYFLWCFNFVLSAFDLASINYIFSTITFKYRAALAFVH